VLLLSSRSLLFLFCPLIFSLFFLLPMSSLLQYLCLSLSLSLSLLL
jgi:hypothetical protein